MDYDRDKVDDATLALMFLTSQPSTALGAPVKATIGMLNRVHEKGVISAPRGKAKVVAHGDEKSNADNLSAFVRWHH